MSEPLIDRNGYEIRAGYLIRRRHFVHYKNRRMVYIHDAVYDSPNGLRCVKFTDIMRGPDDGYPMVQIMQHWWVEIIDGWYETEDGETRAFFHDRKQPPTLKEREPPHPKDNDR